jgi:uncharacterized RDD family membrane protein YckC
MTPADDRRDSEVRERISGLSDDELVALLDGAGEHTPFALSVARQELSKRGGRRAARRRIALRAHASGDPPRSARTRAPAGQDSGPAYDVYDRHDYAGYWRRAAADFLDGLILAIPVAMISLINETVGGLLGLAAFALYHIGLKSDRGTTPGYKLVGIKLVSMDGAAVTLRQVAIRQISSLLSAFPFGLGFLWIAFDPNRQAWHDKIAGTYVVRKDAIRVGKSHVSRSRWLRAAAVVVILVIAVFGGIVVLNGRLQQAVGDSEPYHRSQQYLGSNRWVRQQVGNPTAFRLGAWTLRGNSRTFSILVKGYKGEVSTTVNLEQRGGMWEVVSAFGEDDDGNEVDLMGGPFPGK